MLFTNGLYKTKIYLEGSIKSYVKFERELFLKAQEESQSLAKSLSCEFSEVNYQFDFLVS